MDNALGLIEVIGYVTAIEAADSALKAANVRLIGVTKVDGGIVTVQITGDVGAVKAAVESGGRAAKQVGELRTTHMIPRLDPSVAKILGHGVNTSRTTIQATQVVEKVLDDEVIDVVPTVLEENSTVHEVEEITDDTTVQVAEEVAPMEEINITSETFKKEKLQKISNQELKKLIGELGIKVSSKKLKSAKKEDLVNMIIQFGKEGDISGNN